MRILITGERDWKDESQVTGAIDRMRAGLEPGEVTIVVGDCPTGADAIARDYALRSGFQPEVWFARWAELGLGAGPERNGRMVASGAEYCLAFWSGRTERSGTFDCLLQAVKAGIPVRIIPRRKRAK